MHLAFLILLYVPLVTTFNRKLVLSNPLIFIFILGYRETNIFSRYYFCTYVKRTSTSVKKKEKKREKEKKTK